MRTFLNTVTPNVEFASGIRYDHNTLVTPFLSLHIPNTSVFLGDRLIERMRK